MKIKKEHLEKNFEVIKTKVKREVHPNEWKYNGRQGNEFKMAFIKNMNNLTPEQYDLLIKNKLLLDKEKTEKFLQEVQVDDIVGVKENLYQVVSKGKDYFSGKINKTEKVQDVSLYDISFGLAIEFAEILKRGDDFYGIEQEEDVTIVVPKNNENNKS